jgi:DNA-binding transcriptional LysR family regulator
MVRDQLSLLSAFLVVAEERSFTRAAKRLNVSTSALSHAIRGLEEQIGVRLLARTTRSVAPTEAGERLIARLRPALGDIRDTLDEVASVKDRPVGRVRLLAPRFATRTELTVKLARFAREYPEVVLNVTTDDSRVDLVSSGFDAGIHIGEYIQRDMIAVRVSPDPGRQLSARPSISRAIPFRNRRTIWCVIGASTIDKAPRVCTSGSSKRMTNH